MKFEKWQALGNDYIIIEQRNLPWELTPRRIRKICAAHYGCHADGILLLSEVDDPDCEARLRIFNPDGSEAELSGNGVREAALYLSRSGWADKGTFSIKTAAGEIPLTITGSTDCSVDMGQARLESNDFTGDSQSVDVSGSTWEFTHVSLGNPHAVVMVDEGIEQLDLKQVGPGIENAPAFPRRTNVEFVSLLGDDKIRARIWERGVGETMASGTGASAAAVSAFLKGVSSPLSVSLDGGEIEIDVSDDLHVRMTGPAERVFSGEFSKEFMVALAGERGS